MFKKLENGSIASYRLFGMLKSLLASSKFGQRTMICLMDKFSLHVGHSGGSVFAIRCP